jgi:hypothetical protein
MLGLLDAPEPGICWREYGHASLDFGQMPFRLEERQDSLRYHLVALG